MKIKLNEISIRDVFANYIDMEEAGITGYNGKLNIRPAYQREFVYNIQQRDKVIESIMDNRPLNVMYWAKNADDTFEVLDGQQRTISICQYINGEYSINHKFFHNLLHEEKEQILDYKLMIYICEGTDKEKLNWFKTINIAGEKLTDQELRNAVYTGQWLSDAKRYFSRNNCPAYLMGSDYLKGSPIRQEYLQKVIQWKADFDSIGTIEEYMALHQNNEDANDLWTYYQNVINWITTYFPTKRKEMKQVNWGLLYNNHHKDQLNSNQLEDTIKQLMLDDEVTKKTGIYPYVLTGEEKNLSLRSFSESIKRTTYEIQNGVCPNCHNEYEYHQMQGDHIIPWSRGGKTIKENCQMLCIDCNSRKSNH